MSRRYFTATNGESLLCAVLTGFLLIAIPIRASGSGGGDTAREKLSAGKLTSRIGLSGGKVYYGGLMIAQDDTLTGSVVVIKGSLDMQSGSLLRGEAWVINGDLILTGTAKIDGRAFVVNGADYLSYDAVVEGGTEYFSCECRLDDSRFEESGEVTFVKEEDPRVVRLKPGMKPGRPTRVDYEIARIGLIRRNDRHTQPYTKGHALLHVPVWKESGGFLGFDLALSVPLKGEALWLDLGGFKRTESNDEWMLSRIENGFMVVNTADDFLDYWERRGAEAGISWKPSDALKVALSASYQEDVSLEARSLPSILRNCDRYRENPSIDEGKRLALGIRLEYDSRGDSDWRKNAWRAALWFEKGFETGISDFDYEAFDIDISRYNRIGRSLGIDLRGKLFSSLSRVPGQLTRSLGGFGGVRGARDRPFAVERGDRMALFSLEMRWRLPDVWGISSLFSFWDLLLFTDVGLLTEAGNKEAPFGFLDTDFEEWRKTAGLGFSGQSFLPYVGFYIAQDLDRDSFEPRAILRFEKSF